VGLGLFWNASMLSSNSSYEMPLQGFESPSLPITRDTTMNGNATRTTDDIAILLERYEKRIAELENVLRVYQTSKPNLNMQAGLQLNEANDTMASSITTTTKYHRTNKYNKNKIDKRHVHVIWEDSIKPSILFYQKLMNLTAQQEAEYNDEDDDEEDEDNMQASHQDDKECIPPKILETRTSHPNCNTVHELSFTIEALFNGNLNYLISGGSNDVFRVNTHTYDGNNDDLALKVFSPGKRHKFSIPNSFDYSPKHYEIVDQDAFVMDQLTSSVYVQSVHGHCGFAITVPFASGGTLTGMLERKASRYNMTSIKRLQIAMEVAHGLADIHELGLVHGDLTVNQYFVGGNDDAGGGGVLQLADFNRAIFPKVNVTTIDTNLTKNQTTTTSPTIACKIQLPSLGNPRSPEEYKDETQLTNAVDVWALGSIIYRLLTGNTVWSRNDYTKEEVQERVIKGVLPRISNSILNSTDPVDKVMVKALDMCYTYDPSERPSARDISVYLTTAWRKYELGLSGEPSLN
jgi:serine/threonine protein kinase